MSINMNPIGFRSYDYRTNPAAAGGHNAGRETTVIAGAKGFVAKKQEKNPNAMTMRELLAQNRRKEAESGVLGQSMSYAESIQARRTSNKDTSLKLKKLRYDFKGIASQIMRSKTSAGARQVVGKARREVLRLKRLKQNGDYDSEELEAAISHAKAMERVAKKKVKHLEEEERVKVTGGPCEAELEEREDEEKSIDGEKAEEGSDEADRGRDSAEDTMQAQSDATQQAVQAQMEEYREMMRDMMEEMAREAGARAADSMDEMLASMDGMMSDMMEDMEDSMKDLLEELGLSADSAGAEVEVDPADFKMMKLKHRTDEMKAIAKADSEYLKTLFDHYQKMKNAGGSFGGTSGGSAPSAFGAFSQSAGAAPVPDAGAAAAMPAVSIDISL